MHDGRCEFSAFFDVAFLDVEDFSVGAYVTLRTAFSADDEAGANLSVRGDEQLRPVIRSEIGAGGHDVLQQTLPIDFALPMD